MDSYVHHCVFCGWYRLASSTTLLAPACEACGCTLRASTPDEFARAGRVAEANPGPPSRSGDVTAAFALLVAVPVLLPLVGVDLGDFTFAIPLVLLIFAGSRCVAAVRRGGARRGLWTIMTVCCVLAGVASALVVGTALAGVSATKAFYVGAGASAALLAGLSLFALQALRGVRMERLVDALLAALLVAGLAVHFVAVPGFHAGGTVLTAVFLIDLLAGLAASTAAMVRGGSRHRRVAWALLAAAAGAMAGDAFVALGATEGLGALAVGLCWAGAAYAIALAADGDLDRPEDVEDQEQGAGGRWLLARVVLPILAVLAFPVVAVVLAAAGALTTGAILFFALLFVAELVLAFGRQAWLIVDNRRAVMRERALREETLRRNEELEALTGLATTMTQTLEEAPIIEQALGVLHLAARATSSTLHTDAPQGAALQAVAGGWQEERAWTDGLGPLEEERELHERGGREIVRLALAARGSRIGYVTLIRGKGDPFDEGQLDLLSLLVDQLAVALQNARDYREKLEQAIRDPLTGLYNRRYFFEALEKEVQRSERYGSSASLALFDVDDFKRINDSHGHAAGDEALRAIGRIVDGLIRPSDSFARIGGEEFALLMPETAQLDGLLVAERLRTAISRHSILPGRRVTVSGGLASCPQDATRRDDLERRADAALYWAKRHGKDMCAVASEVVVDQDGGDRDGAIAHLYALVSTIDDSYLHTRDHSENVAAYALALGQALGLDRERVVSLRRAALLHDIGKVAVAEGILSKPTMLTDAEYTEVKLHSVVGGTMLAHAGLEEEASWVRHHHERVDGRGYPDGLIGTDIPLEARIIFVADSFEAMTSDRPYRDGMDVEDAIAELRRCAGSQFEPEIVEALAGLVEAGELTVLALRTSAVPPTPQVR
jgi:diguanylate cyclase (GGDEF)-like protein